MGTTLPAVSHLSIRLDELDTKLDRILTILDREEKGTLQTYEMEGYYPYDADKEDFTQT